MSPQDYSTLRRYSMKYSSDPDDQDELVIQAWLLSERLGAKSEMPLLVNFMKLRGKENSHSILGRRLGGKSRMDVWYHNPVSLSKAVGDDRMATLGEFQADYSADPFDVTVANQFEGSLPGFEHAVLNDFVAGYNVREICNRQNISPWLLKTARDALRRKALEQLI